MKTWFLNYLIGESHKMKKLILVISTLILFAIPTLAQEKNENFKVAGLYSFSQFPGFEAKDFGEYVDGYQVEFRGRVAGKSTRLWGLAVVDRKNDVTQLDPMTYPILLNAMASMSSIQQFSVVQRNTTSLRFGTALSHSFGAFEPYAAISVGFRASNDVQPRKLEQAGQFGGDINIKRVFVRGAYQLTRVTGNNGIEKGYLIGLGFRFK